MSNTNNNNKIKISKLKYFYFILVLSILLISGTYAYQYITTTNSNATGMGGCFNVNYTGQNIATTDLATTTNYQNGSKTTVTLSKHSSCKLYTEANIYLKTNNTTTAPIESIQALKYKVFNGSSQISEGTITTKNDYLLATVPLTNTSTTYTVYLYIDANLSIGNYDGKTYSGYVYATSNQTSTIEGNYLVNFDTNNGENLSLSKTVTNGQPYGWLPTPSKPGYEFTGWGYGIPVTGKTDKAWVTPITDSNFVKTNFKPNTQYKVEYDIILNENIPSGYSASQTSQWGNLGFRTGTSSYSYTMVSGGTLHDKSGSNYTVGQTYHIQGTYTTPSDLSSAIIVFYTARSQNSSGAGYVINGTMKNIIFYETSNNYGPVTNTTTVTQTKNHTLTAMWLEKKINVRFNADGGTVNISNKEVTYGGTYGDLPIPTRSGYTFKGWNGKNLFNKDGIISPYGQITVSNNSITLDGSEVAGNVSTDIRIQNNKDTTFVSNLNIFTRELGKKEFTFTKTENFNKIYIKENTNKKDPGFNTNIINYIDNQKYTVSFNLDYFNSNEAKAIISNLQIEKGAIATAYEPYFVTNSTTVTQDEDHTLTAIWE